MKGSRWRIIEEAGDAILEIGAEEVGALTDPPAGVVIRPLPASPEQRNLGRRPFEVVVDGWRFEFLVDRADRARLRERARRGVSSVTASAETQVRAQIPGRIVAVVVDEGATVDRGQRLLSVEAMKMENEVAAPRAGTIARVSVRAGDRVELGDELVVIR